jgi:hypothetical protein
VEETSVGCIVMCLRGKELGATSSEYIIALLLHYAHDDDVVTNRYMCMLLVNRPLAVSMWRTSHSINLQVAKNEVQSFIDLLSNTDRLTASSSSSSATADTNDD